MLDKVQSGTRAARKTGTLDIEIAAIATAVPPSSIDQLALKDQVLRFYPQFAHMESIYANTGIERRYYVERPEWYMSPRTWEERTEAFQKHALDLLETVTLDAIDQAGLTLDQIDALVVNTTTGLAVPSLDAKLMNRLDFSPNTERLPIFGIGCGGGVAGVARASRIAQTIPGGNVLFLTVELCTLCARVNDPKAAAFVSGALFGDGAAGVILRNPVGDSGGGPTLGRIRASGEHFWRDTEYMMGWDVLNDGFGVVLSAQLPNLVQERFPDAVDAFLARNGLTRDDIAGYIMHPGGAKVLDVAEKSLKLPAEALKPSRETLRDYGNMSSGTVLFVLKRALEAGRKGRQLVLALGPGFSAYFMVLDL